MDIKTEIVALAVRALASKGLVHQPTALEAFIDELFVGESYDKRKAREIIATADKLSAFRQQRKLKKIARKESGTLHVSSDRVD
jgi:hypothetical protein